MAKYHQNNKAVGSLIFDTQHTINRGRGRHFRLWSAFSRSAFRRKLYDTIGCGLSHRHCDEDEETRSAEEEEEEVPPLKKLSDILKTEIGVEAEIEMEEKKSNETEMKRKMGVLEELQGVVKKLQVEEEDELNQMEAALEVRRLAKDDPDARETLAMLGAIPPLVAILDPLRPLHSQIASLYALLNLSIGNDINKAAIVKAGAVHKMLKLIDDGDVTAHNKKELFCNTCSSSSAAAAAVEVAGRQEVIVANFLALSALDSNKAIIGTSGAIPFLVKAVQRVLLVKGEATTSHAKQDCLKAIYNLSILPSNISIFLETDLIGILLRAVGDMEVSEKILSILSNVVSTPHGRKALSSSPEAFTILVDPLNWTDSPGCQEKASYVLMVMAHKTYADRQAMIEAGVMSSLLELTLIGTPLAQKRASRILECLRMDKGKQVQAGTERGLGLLGLANNGATVSAPICGGDSRMSPPQKQHQEEEGDGEEDEEMMSEERKAVKQLVQQSLHKNMRLIIKRANLPQDFVPSQHIRSLTMSSKSLPF